MYNLVMSGGGWPERRGTLLASRAFEYTAKQLIERFQSGTSPDFESLMKLPTVFAEEKSWNDLGQAVRIGTITRVRT